MKKRSHTSGPKQRKAFFDNYKAAVLLAMVLFFSMFAKAQTIDTARVRQSILANPGYWYISLEAYKGLVPPRDTVRLAQKDSGAIAYKNGRYWQYTGAYWDTLRGAIGGGSGGGGGVVNLSKSYTTTSATITPSGGGTAVTLDAVSGTQAGIVTVAQKTSWDSAWTLRVALNDSVAWYYNTKGIAVWKDTAYSTAFARPLYIVDSRTVGVKNDSAAWNAKQLQGRNIATTAPTDGQAMVWDNAGSTWKPGTVSGGGGLSGLTTNRPLIATSSTTAGDDAGLNYDPTTNTLSTDSIMLGSLNLQRMLRNFGGGLATDSIVMAVGVIRPSATGGSGSLISWAFIDDADHTKTYFTNVQGNPSGSSIHISFPKFSKILTMLAVPDETLSGRGIFLGSSVMDTSADIYVYQHIISSGLLQGNGTNFTVSGALTGWTTTFNSGTGAVSFLPPGNLYYNTAADASHMNASYAGTNNYRLRRKVSGLGSDIAGWVMVDNTTNTDVTGAPTSADIIQVEGLPFYRQVSAYQVSGSLYESSIWTASSNIWIVAFGKR